MNIASPANPHLSILHLEDNDHDAELVRRTLENDGIEVEVTRVMKRETFVDALEQGAFDLILSDYSMPGFDGGRALAIAHEKCPTTPFVFVSGTIGEEAAVHVREAVGPRPEVALSATRGRRVHRPEEFGNDVVGVR